ncbi:conserved hypothetical protein [Nitrosococcus halophilus Nc 4]|uniref:Uncharacterized protein n=1 Tax=Nitrosococcus halophilus (strain Nc4) TaxID=472759 RepID=D5C3W7_NITHN|nr:hypothetical protein [Nitrosococcus halophilus]ADE15089.1 conserved hypothetical protein [Nitrosococcus halophilus Nc 4]
MTSITIADLAESKTLDSRQMTTLRGGKALGLPGLSFANVAVDIDLNQEINQFQSLNINAANNVSNFGLFAPNISPTLNQNARLDANLFT